MNTNTKYWSLTWQPNKLQKKIPGELDLIELFNRISEEAKFQYERGSEKGKIHIQGVFTLAGPRQSRTKTLELFKQRFKNISGLTLTPVYDKVAINAYCEKQEGRVKGPFYAGKKEFYNMDVANSKLRNWQQQLFDLLRSEELSKLKDRKVIWIQDDTGGTGKSWFQKWLRLGQKELVVRSLPVSSVDRLMSAVFIIQREVKVDTYCIDLTRTQGEDQSYKDLFASIEQIKNGWVIDVMYGKFHEAYFNPPAVIIFTNNKIEDFRHYLSEDRWKVYNIDKQEDKLTELTSYADWLPFVADKESNCPDSNSNTDQSN